MEDEIPKYATLQYEVRQKLNISWAEYVLADMIYYLSRNRWCNKKLAAIAKDMGLTKQGTLKVLKRLQMKNIIEKSEKGYRTLQGYHETKFNGKKDNMKQSLTQHETKFNDHETKFNDNREQSYKRITIKNRAYKNFIKKRNELFN